MPHKPLANLLIAAFLLLLSMVAVTQGSVPIAAGQLWQSLKLLVTAASETEYAMAHRIIIELRLPRVLLGLMVGAGLALTGLLLQTVTRNELADPYLFGLSSGSAAGAVFVITFTGDVLGLFTLPLAAMTGGLASVAAVLLLLRGYANHSPGQMILAGLSVSFLFNALTYGMTFLGDQRAAQTVLFWTMGGLGTARWNNLFLPFIGLATVLIFALRRNVALDALLTGDLTAHSLGVAPEKLRQQTFLVCAMATACFVATSGVIGFIGLMVPHLVRHWTGPLHRKAFLPTLLIGAALLVGSDLLSRILLAPQELPVGVITAGVGAIFVMRIVLRNSL
ncbi:MAG: iron ABC transporter permease [Propionivibrio sp.]|nr:iron ABC transporter permease [Propionivibrio sp.]